MTEEHVVPAEQRERLEKVLKAISQSDPTIMQVPPGHVLVVEFDQPIDQVLRDGSTAEVDILHPPDEELFKCLGVHADWIREVVTTSRAAGGGTVVVIFSDGGVTTADYYRHTPGVQ